MGKSDSVMSHNRRKWLTSHGIRASAPLIANQPARSATTPPSRRRRAIRRPPHPGFRAATRPRPPGSVLCSPLGSFRANPSATLRGAGGGR